MNLIDVLLTEEGRVLILHALQCKSCNSFGLSYVDMSLVDKDDNVKEAECPMCSSVALKLTTYELLKGE